MRDKRYPFRRHSATDTSENDWSLKERRQILREMLIHEDNLNIARSQALYTIQGFLLASLGLLAKDSRFPPWTLATLIVSISLAGVFSALTYIRDLSHNTKAIDWIVADWAEVSKDAKRPPRIIGYLLKDKTGMVVYESPWLLPRGIMPFVFLFIWLVVAALALAVLV